jgi:N-acetylmuramic acid 6-phosphate (MurNAc-6-P) etherase
MVRLGRVRGNLMAEIRGASQKLRERGIRIVARLARVPVEEAAAVLDDCHGSVPAALERLHVPRRRR